MADHQAAQLRERVDAAKGILRRCRDGINSADAMVDCDRSHTRPDSQWSVACGAGVNPGGATESKAMIALLPQVKAGTVTFVPTL